MKAHRTDGVSLTFALIFLAIAAWWLVAQFLDLTLPAVGWMLAGALILIGVLGLLGALRSGRSAAPAGAGPATVGPVPAGASGSGGASVTPTGAEPTRFTWEDTATTEPVSAPPTSSDDRPRPDDHRD